MEFNTFSELEKYSSKMNTFRVGEKVFVKEENTCYQLDENNEWQPMKAVEINSGATIFEIKKSVLEELGPLNTEELSQIKPVLAEFRTRIKQNFYMLFCKDIAYITLFRAVLDIKETFEEEAFNIITSLGEIYDIGFTSDEQALEIYIKPANDEIRCFLLFGYDAGIVDFRG
jgi:hypothetical protein